MALQGININIRPISTRRGFTLMEIIVVVIIIAIMFGVALPSLRGMRDNNRLRSTVRENMSLMKYARSEAVFNSRTTQVFLDVEKGEFWLDLRTPDEKTGRYNPKAPKTTMERKRKLEKNVFITEVNAMDNNILENGKIIAIDFFPDGTASPTLITYQMEKKGDDGEEAATEYTIEVLKSTGLVEMNEGDLEKTQTAKSERTYPLPDNYYEGYEAGEAVRQ